MYPGVLRKESEAPCNFHRQQALVNVWERLRSLADKWAPLLPFKGKASSCGTFECTESIPFILFCQTGRRRWELCPPPPQSDMAMRRLDPHTEKIDILLVSLPPAKAYIIHQWVSNLECRSEKPWGHIKTQCWLSPRIYIPPVVMGPKNWPVLEFPVVALLLQECYKVSFPSGRDVNSPALSFLSFN